MSDEAVASLEARVAELEKQMKLLRDEVEVLMVTSGITEVERDDEGRIVRLTHEQRR